MKLPPPPRAAILVNTSIYSYVYIFIQWLNDTLTLHLSFGELFLQAWEPTGSPILNTVNVYPWQAWLKSHVFRLHGRMVGRCRNVIPRSQMGHQLPLKKYATHPTAVRIVIMESIVNEHRNELDTCFMFCNLRCLTCSCSKKKKDSLIEIWSSHVCWKF